MAQNNQNEMEEFEGEYNYIRSDVRKVIITNLLILILLFVLFFLDRKTGFVAQLINRF